MTTPGKNPTVDMDAVYRAVGRNILLFQQLEAALRHLLSFSHLSGTAAEFRSLPRRNAKGIRKKSLGSLHKLFLDEVLQRGESPSQGSRTPLTEPTEAHVTVTFRLKLADADWRRKRKQLASLVSERNRLVHHSLAAWVPVSAESTKEFLMTLDDQFHRVKSELNSVRQLLDVCLDMAREVLTSPEFQGEMAASVRRDQ